MNFAIFQLKTSVLEKNYLFCKKNFSPCGLLVLMNMLQKTLDSLSSNRENPSPLQTEILA